jgi:carbonic anhydrase/acetyltransferase-like protein (isoleucine patch superfamily)
MIRSFSGKTPHIDPTAFVSEAAYVVGDVVIGPHSSVWPGVVIRGDMGRITIGSHTNIQDNSVVHSDTDATLGDHVTLGHSVVCHAAVVEDHSLLGNGCVLNDAAIIRDHCIVAAGAVVLAEKEVPSHSIAAGTPAQVRGRVMQRHLDMIDGIAEDYVQMAQRFKAEGLE